MFPKFLLFKAHYELIKLSPAIKICTYFWNFARNLTLVYHVHSLWSTGLNFNFFNWLLPYLLLTRYRCNPYFFAMILAKLPIQLLNSVIYLSMVKTLQLLWNSCYGFFHNQVYLITDQPIELNRIALFYAVSILTSLTSESFGLLISSRLSVIVSWSFQKKSCWINVHFHH